MRNAGLDEAQTGIKIAGRYIVMQICIRTICLSPQICRWHHPCGRKRRTKQPLDERESGEWKSCLKAQHSENEDHGIWPITPWQIDGETVETVSDFIFLGSRITADGDCSHEIKRRLLLGRKVMTNLDSIFKSRDITLPTKVCLVKAMVFPVVMYGCESWTVKKAWGGEEAK